MSNVDTYLAYLAGDYTGELPRPRPIRSEMYLACMCGLIDKADLPAPRDIYSEMYLYNMAVNGAGGGGGGDLPELTNPATAAQIVKDYEAIDQDGNKIVGILTTGDAKITDASYLFYNGARTDYAQELISLLSDVTSAVNMFSSASSLVSVDLSSFDTSKVKSMENMFYGCSKLENLDVSGFDTSAVTNMSQMFGNCSNLTTLDLSGFDTSKVTTMRDMFSGCSNLTTLDVSRFNTSSVTNMTRMFSQCGRLERLDVSGFDTSKVTSMGTMFNRCYFMRELIGFSATCNAGMAIALPSGLANNRAALCRLTFPTDLPEGQYAIRSAINIQHCSFKRSGMVEMFNTLTDVSGLGFSSSYTTISIAGNPCVSDKILVKADSSYRTNLTYDDLCSNANRLYAGYDYSDAPIQYYLTSAGSSRAVTGTMADITAEILADDTINVKFMANTITVPVEDKLTDEDRAIATAKGWTIAE